MTRKQRSNERPERGPQTRLRSLGAVRGARDRVPGGWWVYALVLFIGTLCLYSPSIGFGFTMDDPLVTALNADVSATDGDISRYFTHGFYEATTYGTQNNNLYRPVTSLSLALNYRASGHRFDTRAFHLTNVFLYALCVLVAFLCLRTLLERSRWRTAASAWLFAFLIAALFAVLPSHTESVANIKHREEVLALLFGLLAWLCVLGPRSRQRIWSAMLAGVAFFLAIGSKESALLLLPCMLLFEWVFGSRRSGRWWPFAVLALSILVYAQLRHAALGALFSPSGTRTFFDASVPALDRVLFSSRSFLEYYIWDQLVTQRLNPAFSSPFVVPHIGDPGLLGLLSFLLLVLSAALALILLVRKKSLAAFAWLVFLVTAVLTLQPIAIGTGGAFRLVFTASFGLACFVGSALIGPGARTPAWRQLAMGLVIALYAIVTVVRMGNWENDERLFGYAARVEQDDPMAAYALASVITGPERVSERLAILEESVHRFQNAPLSLDAYPERALDAYSVVATEVGYSRIEPDPRAAIGLAETGIDLFERRAALNDGRVDSNIGGPYLVKALAQRRLGDVAAAIETCETGIALTPHRGLRMLLAELQKEAVPRPTS